MKSEVWDLGFERRLLACGSYREFLGCFFCKDDGRSSPKPVSFGEFAIRAGFASKAFMSDVIKGRKRLTPNSLHRVADGLRLDALWSEYLKTLTDLDETDFRSRHATPTQLRRHLAGCRKRLKLRHTARAFHGGSALVELFLQEGFPEVYAALGDGETGVDMATIRARSRLQDRAVRELLARMIDAGLVEPLPDGTHRARQGALEARALRSNAVFELDFFRALDKMRRRFPRQASHGASLFTVQTFAVRSAELPRLRSELSRLIEAFAAEAEDTDGDCVAEVCLGFTNNL